MVPDESSPIQAFCNDDERLAALRRYGILDSTPEEAFGDIVRLIAEICQTPIAVINFIDRERQWFKSHVGFEGCTPPLSDSICAHALLSADLLIVPDLALDPRFRANPQVASEPNLRFYAGCLLRTQEGHAIGTLCVLDYQPRNLTDGQTSALRILGRQVMSHLELRRSLAANVEVNAARRVAEINMLEFRDRYDLAVEAAEVGTWSCPMPAGEILMSARCIEHLWLPPGRRIDFDLFYSVLHEEDRDRTRDAVAGAIELGVPYDAEYRVVAPDGRTRWIRAKGRATYDSSGKPLRFDGITLDITDQKVTDVLRLESEVIREQLLASERAARAEAERAGRMKDEFLATLSHELRTPLNAVVGWAQILRRGVSSPEDLKQGLETIERNARVQAQIIEDLLDMSRIISGKVRLDVQRLDLASIVQAAIDTSRPAGDAKDIVIRAVLDPHAGLVSGDPNRLQQVLWNLLSNAIKFTPKGGKVQILLERVNSHLELSVSDNGEGIKPEFLPHVFDRFRQADASTTRRHGGLGLGLAIVKQIVELHGGSVQVKSPGAGLGTTFIISLPVVVLRTEAGDAGARRHPRSGPTDAIEFDMCGSIKDLRVLVVDDEPDARLLVQRLLEECEATVITAESAEQAVNAVLHHRPDVIVSDVGMPDEDGYSMIRRVRALGIARGGSVPAIALTAYARAEDRVRSVLAGFQLHIVKPVEPTELIAMVASLAGRTKTPTIE